MGEEAAVAEVLALEIVTPHGTLRPRLRLPPRPMRLAELAASFMGFSDHIVRLAVAAEEKQGKRVTCAAGCGACCRQLVPLSPPEAWMVADVVAALRPEERAGVLDRFADARAAIEAARLDELYAAGLPSPDEATLAARRYFLASRPCPFLVDESCSIHATRPSICREYLVTSPAERCADLFQIGKPAVERISVGVRLSEGLSRLAAKLLDRPMEVVPLVQALDWADRHREEGALRWPPRLLIEGLVAALSEKPEAPSDRVNQKVEPGS